MADDVKDKKIANINQEGQQKQIAGYDNNNFESYYEESADEKLDMLLGKPVTNFIKGAFHLIGKIIREAADLIKFRLMPGDIRRQIFMADMMDQKNKSMAQEDKKKGTQKQNTFDNKDRQKDTRNHDTQDQEDMKKETDINAEDEKKTKSASDEQENKLLDVEAAYLDSLEQIDYDGYDPMQEYDQNDMENDEDMRIMKENLELSIKDSHDFLLASGYESIVVSSINNSGPVLLLKDTENGNIAKVDIASMVNNGSSSISIQPVIDAVLNLDADKHIADTNKSLSAFYKSAVIASKIMSKTNIQYSFAESVGSGKNEMILSGISDKSDPSRIAVSFWYNSLGENGPFYLGDISYHDYEKDNDPKTLNESADKLELLIKQQIPELKEVIFPEKQSINVIANDAVENHLLESFFEDKSEPLSVNQEEKIDAMDNSLEINIDLFDDDIIFREPEQKKVVCDDTTHDSCDDNTTHGSTIYDEEEMVMC